MTLHLKPGANAQGRPVVVTGMPRSGTSWVGKMLELSGELVYINEPMNPKHPPGRSPGLLHADVQHYFHYISDDNDQDWLPAYKKSARLKYSLTAELRRNRGRYDLARAAKYQYEFGRGRITGKRALFDDPYAVVSARWLVRHLGARVVVLVRDPLTLVQSWLKLNWCESPQVLLDQHLLVRDHLQDQQERLSVAAASDDPVVQIAALWSAVYTVVLNSLADDGILVRRYEDLATNPMEGFAELYDWCRLSWSAKAQEGVRSATSGESPGKSSSAHPFAWSLRTGVSRTAFRPMDSAAMVKQRDSVDEDVATRVREWTDDVNARLALLSGPAPDAG
jgi:Sulfotransferase family